MGRATSRAVFTRFSSFCLFLISIDAARNFRRALQFLRKGQKLNRRMVSLKGRAVILGRNPPVTKKMEKRQMTMANILIIEFIQFVIQIKGYFNEKNSGFICKHLLVSVNNFRLIAQVIYELQYFNIISLNYREYKIFKIFIKLYTKYIWTLSCTCWKY